jgi:hypothetical protein
MGNGSGCLSGLHLYHLWEDLGGYNPYREMICRFCGDTIMGKGWRIKLFNKRNRFRVVDEGCFDYFLRKDSIVEHCIYTKTRSKTLTPAVIDGGDIHGSGESGGRGK